MHMLMYSATLHYTNCTALLLALHYTDYIALCYSALIAVRYAPVTLQLQPQQLHYVAVHARTPQL